MEWWCDRLIQGVLLKKKKQKNQKQNQNIHNSTNATAIIDHLCTESRSKILFTSILGEKHGLKVFEGLLLFLFGWFGHK